MGTAQQDVENANGIFASIFCAQAPEGVLTDVLRRAVPPGGRPLIPSPAAVLGDLTGAACELVLPSQLGLGGNPPVVVEPVHLVPDSPSGSHHRHAPNPVHPILP